MAIDDTTRRTALDHEPVIPPMLVRGVPALLPGLIERFEGIPATDVADVVGPLYTMMPGIEPMFRPIARIAGRAVTVKAWPADNLAVHGALGIVEYGDVLVVDWRGYLGACGSGAQSLVVPFARGLRGVVIDGGWRDAEELEELGFPVFARGVSPSSPPKARPGEVNVPVCCGGVVVAPGDLVVADAECVAVVPRAFVEAVADALPLRPGPAQTPDERERRTAARADYYRSRFDAAGGLEREWSGEPAS